MKNFEIISDKEAMSIYGGLSDKTLRELMNLIGKLLGAGLRYLLDLLRDKSGPQTT